MRGLGPSDAYKERAQDPTLRIRCDFCARCFVYNCDGSTAKHHDIHFNVAGWFTRELDGEAD